jgi:hypothetical protein
MDNAPIQWILDDGPPWAQVIALRDLLGRPPDDPELSAARAAMLAHPLIVALLDDVAAWPNGPLKRHNDASHPLHKMATLAAFGLTQDHPKLAPAVEFILSHPHEDGALQTMIEVPERFGGDGTPKLNWMLCDAPTVLYAVLRLGVAPDVPAVARAIDHLTGLAQDIGWPCAAAAEFGKFRGPGRKDDPCPYANLIAIKALALASGMKESDAARAGVEMLLRHWERQKERKLYMFGIGTDFRKPKYPPVWYDIAHVTDVLSQYPAARRDPRFQEMVGELRAAVDEQGRVTAASMYRAWKGWDFADKKTPSPTITAVVWRTLQRLEAS